MKDIWKGVGPGKAQVERRSPAARNAALAASRLSATRPFGPCVGPYPIYAAEHRHSSSGHATIRSQSASGTLNSLIAARKFSCATSGLSNVVAEPNGQRSETILVGRASLHDSSRLANTTL